MKEPRNFVFWAIGMLGGTAILAAFLGLLVVNHERQQLKEYRAYLVKRGEKLTVEELIPPKPSERNKGAEDLIAAALELSADKKFQERKKISSGKSTKAGDAEVVHRLPKAPGRYAIESPWTEAAAAMAGWEPLLERIRQATQMPGAEFAPNFGASAPFQTLSAIRDAARLLSEAAILKLHEGKTSAAVQDVVALLRIIRMLERQPHYYGQSPALSLTCTAQGATWEILQASGLDGAKLASLQNAWQELNPREKIKPLLQTARAMAEREFSNIGEAGGRPQLIYFGIWELAFRDYDERATLTDYQNLLDQAPGPEGNWQPFLKTADRIQKTNAGTFSRYYSNSTTPLSRGYFANVSARETIRALAIAAIALRRYQLDHREEIPSSLAELCPQYLSEEPLDPMDGKPLRYLPKEDRTYRLYSVGTDGVDDGGDASSTTPGDFYSLLDRSEGNISSRKDLVWPMAASP